MPPRPAHPPVDDTFTLHDLRVEVIATDRPMVCNHKAGDWFELSGENLRFPDGQTFPLYPLAALLPLLPAKQRPTHPHDWMTTDAEIACPDPHCGARFRITRIGTTTFSHAAVTAVPLPPPDPDARVKASLLPHHAAVLPGATAATAAPTTKAKTKAKNKTKAKAKAKAKDRATTEAEPRDGAKKGKHKATRGATDDAPQRRTKARTGKRGRHA